MTESLIPIFFAEKTVTANTYLNMLQLYGMPQLPDGTIYNQDGLASHLAGPGSVPVRVSSPG